MDKDSSVHLIYHDPSDLGSLILIRIISEERTLSIKTRSNRSLGECVRYVCYIRRRGSSGGERVDGSCDR